MLDALKNAAAQEPKAASNGAASPANAMPYIIISDAICAYATVGICGGCTAPRCAASLTLSSFAAAQSA